MKAPLFAADEYDIIAFKDAKAMEGYLEAQDVKGGEYRAAYDSEGRLLELSIVPREVHGPFGSSWQVEGVAVRAAEDSPAHAAELAALLWNYALQHKLEKLHGPRPALASLVELVSKHVLVE
jgi:hypothetical protein